MVTGVFALVDSAEFGGGGGRGICVLRGSLIGVVCLSIGLYVSIEGCGFKSYPWYWRWMPIRVCCLVMELLSNVHWYSQGLTNGWQGRAHPTLHAL